MATALTVQPVMPPPKRLLRESGTKELLSAFKVVARHVLVYLSAPRASALGHPGQPQALIEALASREIHWIVAWGTSAIPADSETRIERKARLRCSACLVQLAGQRQKTPEEQTPQGV